MRGVLLTNTTHDTDRRAIKAMLTNLIPSQTPIQSQSPHKAIKIWPREFVRSILPPRNLLPAQPTEERLLISTSNSKSAPQIRKPSKTILIHDGAAKSIRNNAMKLSAYLFPSINSPISKSLPFCHLQLPTKRKGFKVTHPRPPSLKKLLAENPQVRILRSNGGETIPRILPKESLFSSLAYPKQAILN